MLLLALTCIAAAAYFTVDAVTAPARARRSAARRAATYGRVERRERLLPADVRGRMLTSLESRLAHYVVRFTPRLDADTVQQKLLAAGVSRRISPTRFLALKGAAILGGFLFGLLLGRPLVVLAFGFCGFFGPDMWLTMKGRARKEQIRADLPDALDLLAVSVEAGLGFDGAITKLTEHMHGPLADEFGLSLGEMRIGESRQEALKKMAERVAVPEMAAFTRAVIQADQLGISLGRILRVQAAEARNRRQMAAEERAMKAPIKMLFPTVMFIFPAMFIVILGPAFLNLSKLF